MSIYSLHLLPPYARKLLGKKNSLVKMTTTLKTTLPLGKHLLVLGVKGQAALSIIPHLSLGSIQLVLWLMWSM